MGEGWYLIFRLSGSLYGVDAASVLETVMLPELALVEEAPPYIRGVFNLRGRVAPVIDIGIKFGHKPEPYNLNDIVVVMESGGALAGVIGNEAVEVREIRANDIEVLPPYAHGEAQGAGFILGEAKSGADLIMILDISRLLSTGQGVAGPAPALMEAETLISGHPAFCPEAGPVERLAFRERALKLMKSPEEAAAEGLIPLAVAGMEGEYIAFEMSSVAEFSDITAVAPVPCCPPHIMGSMNLRGNIVTLIDIRAVLGMPRANTAGLKKAVIAGLGGTYAGAAVEDVFDVVFLLPSAVMPMPRTAKDKGERYVLGAAPYAGKFMTVINLSMLLQSEELVVDEGA
ncbi:MAG: chemotaxis protein CheW [Deltaproteobacteria bacterium]|nr:chemotaxis protein CheW [Deltaproteobacteria bacterium]